MLQVLIIPLITIIAIATMGVVVGLFTRSKSVTPGERLNKRFDYRKEPHADQLTEYPNKLSENEVTGG